jgi:hypothetical protein
LGGRRGIRRTAVNVVETGPEQAPPTAFPMRHRLNGYKRCTRTPMFRSAAVGWRRIIEVAMSCLSQTIRSSAPRPRLELHSSGAPQRAVVESFIREAYRRHFDADVTHFMPQLLSLNDARGNIRAAVGYRHAAAETLFLEHYTDGPIEGLISGTAGRAVERREIVEIGGLACRNPRAALVLVATLVPYLLEHGFSWAVFTGADTIQRVLTRMRLFPLALCAAAPEKLGAERHQWGRYYAHDPRVLAGRLGNGLRILSQSGALA